jgi:hypothetical protein
MKKSDFNVALPESKGRYLDDFAVDKSDCPLKKIRHEHDLGSHPMTSGL